MRLAHIVPYPYIDLVMEHTLHMAIGPILVKYKKWEDFYTRAQSSSSIWGAEKQNRIWWQVILDNGAFENIPMKFPELVDLAVRMQVYGIILPDVFRDGNETCRVVAGINPQLWDRLKANSIKTMFVVHGPTPADCLYCSGEALKQDRVDIIGFSYIPITEAYSQFFRSDYCGIVRPMAIALLNEKLGFVGKKNIHCLGLSSPHEVKSLEQLGLVNSCDSSLAAKATYANIKFGAEHLRSEFWENRELLPRPENFFETAKLDRKILKYNIQFLDDIVGGLYDKDRSDSH